MCVVRVERTVETTVKTYLTEVVKKLNPPKNKVPVGAVANLHDLNRALIGKKEVQLFIASKQFRSVESVIYRGEAGQKVRFEDNKAVDSIYEYFVVYNTYGGNPKEYSNERSQMDAHLLPQDYNDWYVFLDELAANNHRFGLKD